MADTTTALCGPISREPIETMIMAGPKPVAPFRKKARKAGAKKVQTAIGSGDPATSVAGFAKRRKIDLIVVGTRGLSKIKAASMGSVSRKLMDLTDVNCAVIR